MTWAEAMDLTYSQLGMVLEASRRRRAGELENALLAVHSGLSSDGFNAALKRLHKLSDPEA